MYKRAIILAGGKGTRLKPYTISLPKPLVPVGDKPVLEIVINRLIKDGFDHVTITVGYLGDIIKAYFENGSKWGIKIDYAHEDIPLGTMGPLRMINDLPDNFLIMNGDVLTDLDLALFYQNHKNEHQMFSIAAARRIAKIDYGVIEYNSSNELSAFIEKPEHKYSVSMGVYMANKNVCKYIPQNVAYGFDELMLKLLAEQVNVAIHPHDGFWLDIGRPSDYEKAIDYYDRGENALI